MTQSNVRFFFTDLMRYGTFFVFSFFLFGSTFSSFLYAAVIVKDISFDAEAEKMVWVEEDGKLKIKEAGELLTGETLSESCRICVSKGEVVIEKDGQDIKVGAGQFLDLREGQTQKDKTSYVKVAEGKVEYQAKFDDNGKSKLLGNPIIVHGGEVLLMKNECFVFIKMSISEFEELQAYGSVAAAQVPALPGSEPGGEDAAPCASAPC